MFFKQVNKKDSGVTVISNFFLDIFMPMANGLFVKVYLLAYRHACDTRSNPKFNNHSLARDLNVPLSDIVDAWKYWEEQKLVIIHPHDSSDKFDFSVEFLDINNLQKNSNPVKSEVDILVEARENPSYVNMFNSINKIIGRSLAPNESIRLLNLINEYNLTPDLVIFAYEYCKEKNGNAKPIQYVETVLRSWYDENIMTIEQAQNSFVVRKDRYSIYSKILRELGFNRQPTNAEKDMMDIWIDEYKFSQELIIYACSKSKNIPNPSISYINGIIESWHSKNISTMEDIQKEEEEFKKNKENKFEEAKKSTPKQNSYKPKNKISTRYHNSFNEHFRKYDPDELEKKLLQVQKAKLLKSQNKNSKEGD